MGEYKRLAVLVLIMIGVCLIVGATAIGMIYEEALDRERERLVNIAQSQARLMEALARLEAPPSNRGRATDSGCPFEDPGSASPPARAGDWPDRRAAACAPRRRLHRVSDACAWLASTSRSCRLRRSGGRTDDRGALRAFGHDDRPRLCRAPGAGGLRAGPRPRPRSGRQDRHGGDQRAVSARRLIAGLVSLAAVLGAVLLFFRIGEPMIRRLRESESRYRELFDNMDIGVAVCHARLARRRLHLEGLQPRRRTHRANRTSEVDRPVADGNVSGSPRVRLDRCVDARLANGRGRAASHPLLPGRAHRRVAGRLCLQTAERRGRHPFFRRVRT